MKKSILIALGLVTVAGLFVVGVTFAQGEKPLFGQGRGDGTGSLHEYMEKAMADALGLSLKDFEARHDAGETFYEIALSKGFAADDIPALMKSVRDTALDAATADGVITQAQAEWMKARGFGRGGGNYGPGYPNEECTMYGDAPHFRGSDPGKMSGTLGDRGWQSQNQ